MGNLGECVRRSLFGVVFVVSFLALPVAIAMMWAQVLPWEGVWVCSMLMLLSEHLDRRIKGVR